MSRRYTVLHALFDLLDPENLFDRTMRTAAGLPWYRRCTRGEIVSAILKKKRRFSDDDEDGDREALMFKFGQSWLNSRRKSLEECLLIGRFSAWGFPKGSHQLVPIPPTLWSSLTIDILKSAASTKNGSHVFSGIEIRPTKSFSPFIESLGEFQSLQERHSIQAGGRPKKDYSYVIAEHERRVEENEAFASMNREAEYLADWAVREGHYDPPKKEAIRRALRALKAAQKVGKNR